MVVLLDLDEDVLDPHADVKHGGGFVDFGHDLSNGALISNGKRKGIDDGKGEERENPNINGFSAALGCYPIVSQITRSLDLNDLDAISRTCRQFRVNLLQFRRQLVKQILRCRNEEASSIAGAEARIADSERGWHVSGDGDVGHGRMTIGNIGACARDMVADCRRCGRVVCRNCTIKAPTTSNLPNRHRRLCSTCLSLPLNYHTLSPPPPYLPLTHPPPPPTFAFTSTAFARTPCTCAHSVWLCRPCGSSLRNSDTTYKRVWTWRTRYSTNLGGLGTGIGEGNEGVQCGRGDRCFAAKYTEVERDCGAEDLAALQSSQQVGEETRTTTTTTITTVKHDEQTGDNSSNGALEKAGYLRQEIEGIGGVVKKKVKRRVKVGRAVREHEDERERAEYLEREGRGEERSWCAWCARVVPGKKDLRGG
ncbi:MAG: hypothetical protein M1830_000054 [Pleopsidium flavum]|nr:MAG: hypothetical protein M1830_000054 [Pleopsidium flavum]